MKNKLQASFLGGIKFLWKGKIVNQFATKKVLGLFCYLADNPDVVFSRDKLMLIFWGEFPESQARYNLRYALWNIRKLFKENVDDIDPLVTSRTSCQINPEFTVSIDKDEFLKLVQKTNGQDQIENLKQAVSIYKGAFLEGFTIRNLPEWEEWIYQRREEYQQHFLNAIVELGNHYLRTNQTPNAIQLFNRALATAPDYEPAHEGVIRGFADQGKVSTALRHYNKYVEIMKRDFKAPPHPEIQKLSEALRKGEYDEEKIVLPETIDVSESQISPQSVEQTVLEDAAMTEERIKQTSHNIQVLSSTRFIGRQSELKDFDHILREVRAGKGQVLIISGEMGIGKTRLFSEFLSKIPSEFFIGVGEAEELQSTRPLEEFIRVFEDLRKDNRLPEDLRASLLKILKEGNNVKDDNSTEEYLPKAIRNWTTSLARRSPVLIALDDMHWVSESALKIFAELSQDVKRLPMLLVGIFRTFELQSEDEIASSLISIARTGRLWRMELGELSEDETISLMTAKSDKIANSLKEQDYAKIYNYCSGIPLYAVELAQFLEDGRLDVLGSPSIEGKPEFSIKSSRQIVPSLLIKITNHRLSQFSDTLINILKSSSLLIGNFSLEFIGALVEQETDTLENNLVELEHRNFLHHTEGENKIVFGFNHQMVKLAIAQSMSTFERRKLFKAIVKTIEVTAENVSSDAKAYYLYNSGDQIGAVPHLLNSAESWLSLGDRSNGLDYSRIAYKIALDGADHGLDFTLDTIDKHVNNLRQQSGVKEAIDVYHNILERLKSEIRPEQAEAINRKIDKLKELLRVEKIQKPRGLPPLVLVTTKRALANTKLAQGDLEGALKLLEDAEKRLESLPDSPATIRETGIVIQIQAKIAMKKENTSEALRLLSNAMELILLHGTSAQMAETWRLFGEIYTGQRNFDFAAEALRQCQTLAEQDQNLLELTYCRRLQAKLMEEMGDIDEAENMYRSAIAHTVDLPELSEQLPRIQIGLAKILLRKGARAEAETIINDIEHQNINRNNQAIESELQDLKDSLK